MSNASQCAVVTKALIGAFLQNAKSCAVKTSVLHRYLGFAASLLIAVQLAGPGLLTQAYGDAAADFMCMPSGELSPEGRAAAREFQELVSGGPRFPDDTAGHCPLCLAAHAYLPAHSLKRI